MVGIRDCHSGSYFGFILTSIKQNRNNYVETINDRKVGP